ncbi:DUF4174 domain-containing protein [Aureimonas flava]|uniref:DUF4174 domain-containing protein n=1 Tax=Aureimonas flava TaxID=2320271 RepID=A0A3A1WM02_9HYPH|nr:DUF4174 domain-containing protein [Aureimonas flava]RIY01465.1 DUF4174 domain-containing protein [Aureimonas flava]
MDTGLLAPIIMASTMAASAAGLDALRWERRVLLVFSSAAGEAEAKRQETLLKGRERDLEERRMTVIAVSGDVVRVLAGPSAPDLSAEDLRRRTGVGDAPFAAVLVGLDGGTKWTSQRPASLDDINAVVDAMPMRRAGTDR